MESDEFEFHHTKYANELGEGISLPFVKT